MRSCSRRVDSMLPEPSLLRMKSRDSNRAAGWRRRLKRLGIGLLALVGFIWANNTSVFSKVPPGRPKLLAHKGFHQTFEIQGLRWDSNTAAIIHPPEHSYLENTIPSIEAAFISGADMVEFDVRLTRDGKLAVFHDFLLDYRTDGTGLVSEATMADLRKLDVGYGYTADGGETFPFRGRGVGMIVTIEEVLERFPEHPFLIDVKDGGAESGRILVELFRTKSSRWREAIGVVASKDTNSVIHAAFPSVKAHSYRSLKKALISYELIGWTGYIPSEIRGTQLQIPLRYARCLWGWPDKFLNRMAKVNTRVILVNGDGQWSEGFDSENELESIPETFNGFVWSNRADRIAGSNWFNP